MRLTVLLLMLLLAAVVAMPPLPQASFTRACSAMAVDCSGIEPPVIVVSQVLKDMECPGCSFRGVNYEGEPYIFLNALMGDEEKERVEFHETIHYVAGMLGMDMETCEEEHMARSLTASEFDFEVDPNWRQWYGCTEEE